MNLYKLSSGNTISKLYGDAINARSVGANEFIILTKFSANVTCSIQYYDTITGDVINRSVITNINTNSAYGDYFSNPSEAFEGGIAYIHTVPEQVLNKGGTLRFSFKFESTDGKVVTTGMLTETVNGSTWEYDPDEQETVVIDNRYWPIASDTQIGAVKVDNDTIVISDDGVISVTPDTIAIEANPVGTATADLVRIRVEDTIYNVVCSGTGTGGSLYVESDDDGNVVLGFN